MKKQLTGWLAAMTLALLLPFSSAQAALAVGTDYVAIDPILPTDNPAKIEAVSYTHLDVYKRQSVDSALRCRTSAPGRQQCRFYSAPPSRGRLAVDCRSPAAT